MAKKRRLPSSKGFDFFVESSFVELYNETCRDLYNKSGPAGAPNLPVSESQWIEGGSSSNRRLPDADMHNLQWPRSFQQQNPQ